MDTAVRMTVACVCAGFVVAILPCIGWSHYKFNNDTLSCNIEWIEPTLNVRSYIFFIVMVLYVIPLSLIVFASIKSYNKVNFSFSF